MTTPIQHLLVGQRVIVGDEIGVIVRPTMQQGRGLFDHWVRTSLGTHCYVDKDVRALPGGQL